MFFSCKVLGFSIKIRKVLVVFCREIMKDQRQVKGNISSLGIDATESFGKDMPLDMAS